MYSLVWVQLNLATGQRAINVKVGLSQIRWCSWKPNCRWKKLKDMKTCPQKQMFVLIVLSKIRASLWNSVSLFYPKKKNLSFLRERKRTKKRKKRRGREQRRKKRPEEKERKREEEERRRRERKLAFFHPCSHSNLWQESSFWYFLLLPLLFTLESLAIWLFPPSQSENYFCDSLQKPYSCKIWWELNYHCNRFLTEFKYLLTPFEMLAFLYVAITWSSSTFICSISFFLGFFFLQLTLFTLWFTSKILSLHLPIIYTLSMTVLANSVLSGARYLWLLIFIFSTDPSVEPQFCISRLVCFPVVTSGKEPACQCRRH